MNVIISRAAILAVLGFTLSSAHAGRYPVSGVQEFTYPDNTTKYPATAAAGTFTDPLPAATLTSSFLGTFSKIFSNSLQLSNKSSPGNSGAFRISNLDTGNAIQSFDASFTVRMEKSGTAQPGTGWSLNFGPIPVSGNGSGDLGYSMVGGIVLSFDTYANTVNDVPSIEVICNNTSVGNFPMSQLTQPSPVTGGTFTLRNPAVTTGTTTTGNISWNASILAVQTAMRLVNGWAGVTVTGAPNAWVVTMDSNGSYADPIGNGAALTAPAFAAPGGQVTVSNTQDGTVSLPEVWTISHATHGLVFDPTYRPVVCHWDYDGLDLTYNGQTIFTDLPTPGFVPASGQTFAFSATAGVSGSGSQDTYFDDLLLTTAPAVPPDTGGPIISEFMAENKETMEDEDMETPDWIEIYNGHNVVTNLNGYKLTDGTTTWTFPSVNVAAYAHLVVFASGKNRILNPALLHTNFTLQKTGGTVSLLNPSNTVVSTYTFPNQIEDVSYGMKYQGGAIGFLSPISPGAATTYSQYVAPNGPAQDVYWSREGGLITGSTPISVPVPPPPPPPDLPFPPYAPGAVVRYTTDNTAPTAAAPVFPATLNVATSTNVRARVFTPGYLPGPVSSRTFLLLDTSLANYNGSGQPFKSHLPLIVLDSFGVNVDGVTDQAQPRPHRFTYSVVIDKDPVTGFADITSATPDFRGRAGTHVRGDSSGGFAQKSYAWETWDNDNNDKDVSILGMPADSDWALHGPYTDKTFFRNLITNDKLRELHAGEDGYAMRSKLVEVIYNQDPGQAVSYNDYRGVYVLMERIKRGSNRIDIAKLNSLATSPALIPGGYIFRRDRLSADGNTGLPVGMHSHTPNILNAAQTTWLSNHITAFNNALNGANFADPVLGYAPYIDVESFIDCWWFFEAFKQIDGYRLSTYFYKDRGANKKIVAGPIWDFNLSLGNADYLAGDQFAGWYWNQTDSYWWARLRQDPNYEIRNWDRYWQIRRSIFDTTSISAYIDGLKLKVTNGSVTPVTNNMSLPAGQPSTNENAAMRHYRKYQVLGTYLWPNAGGAPAAAATLNPRPWQVNTTFQSEVDWMKGWLSQRLNWIDNQYAFGGVIYRPPNFSNMGGIVTAGTQLDITRYTGTPPAGFSYPAGGTIFYTLDGTDPRAPAAPVTENPLISGTTNACKWLVPSAVNGGITLTASPGADQWTSYTDPVNIGNWTTGTTGIGYDTAATYNTYLGANGNTQAPMYADVNATAYLRVPFTIPDQATIDAIATGSLRLSARYEDGFRAYINGVSVAGSNDTHASMTSNPATAQATIARDETAAVNWEDFDVTGTGVPALRVGLNMLAIHCLNGVDFTSTDLLMVPKLTWSPPVVGGGGGGQAYTGPLTINTSTTVKARLFANNVWSPMTTAAFIVNAVPASAANVVISEIHYRPVDPLLLELAEGYNVANDFEFVELLNVSAQTVDLSNCRFTDGITYDFGSVDAGALSLPPGGRILVVENRLAFLFRNGNSPSVRIAGEFTGNLNNSGELLTLLAANDSVIASFTYDTDEPWPVDADGPGFSLVLNNPGSNPAYAQATSWRSSSSIGGSPGVSNSTAFSGSPGGDSDLDGSSDFLEYAMGTNWNNASAAPLLVHSLIVNPPGAEPGTYLSYSYSRNLGADGVVLTPQHSSDLSNWSAAGIVYMNTSNIGNGTASVTCRSAAPVEGPIGRSYMRVMVSAP